MVLGASNISMPAISYTAGNYGKMSLPVDSSALIYSHFEHVSGIPAPEGTQGVTISKLNLLDVLIGQLNQINRASPGKSPANPTGGVDALIENLESQIRQAKSESASMPYIPAPSAEPGILFSLLG